MVLELHVWGPAFGLPSIDAECLAAIAYLNHALPPTEWVLIANHDTSISPRHELPVLDDSSVRTSGFPDIVSYLRRRNSASINLDDHLTHEQQTDRTAFLSHLESTGHPLIDLSLYISSENYNTTTSSAYTAILPWHLNYTIPPTRRDLARSRTAHLGLSNLEINTAEQNGGSKTGSRSVGSDFEAAKRDAGIPTEPAVLNMGRKTGIQGMLSSPVYAARFKLDALANEFLEPLSDLLGMKDYLFEGDKPSSLDCAAFGYLALMFYPPVPQAWLKEAIQTKFPRLLRYIERMREELLGNEETKAADIWSLSYHKDGDSEIQTTLQRLGLCLPWRPPPPKDLYSRMATVTWEITRNLPLFSIVLRPGVLVQTDASTPRRQVKSSLPSPLTMNVFFAFSATITAALAGMAIHHRRSPREGPLVFWALRARAEGLGEAGNILRGFANQLAMPQGG